MNKYLKFIPYVIIIVLLAYIGILRTGQSVKITTKNVKMKLHKTKAEVRYNNIYVDRLIDRVIKPDGTIQEHIHETTKDTSTIDTKETTDKTVDTKTVEVVKPVEKDYLIGLSYNLLNNSNFKVENASFEVNRRILGGFYLGIESNLQFNTLNLKMKYLF